MSTTSLPAASDSLIGLIQPYVDDVLPPDERARVDAVLAEDPVLREMVEEQCSVRQALQKLPRPAAPQALQARVLLELDAIDREQAAAPALPVIAAPRWPRLRSFFRGAAVMVPAGAQTGPTQGTGTRNKRSGSVRDAGQSRSTFNQT